MTRKYILQPILLIRLRSSTKQLEIPQDERLGPIDDNCSSSRNVAVNLNKQMYTSC